jgi:hypothetical protein
VFETPVLNAEVNLTVHIFVSQRLPLFTVKLNLLQNSQSLKGKAEKNFV